MKRKITALCLVVALLAVAIVGGTMAYFTDTESADNVFTIGNIDILLKEDINNDGNADNDGKDQIFYPDSMMPGVEVEKDAWILNNGKNDAYVRAKVYVPANIKPVWDSAFTDWALSDTTTKETIEGVEYTVYTATFQKVLEGGKWTPEFLTGVMLDPFYNNSYPDTYVDQKISVKINAEAIQAAGFADVNAAFAAFEQQVLVDSAPMTEVATIAELEAAIASANPIANIKLADGEYTFTQISIDSGKTVSIFGSANAVVEGQFKVVGTLNLNGITVDDPDATVAGEVSQYSKSAIALVNSGDVVCTGVTFNQDLADGTAITAWWSTGDGANITVRNCVFNSNGQRPIRSDACVTVENCTFNDPYRYAVQMTSKSSTMADDALAYVNFNNNTINAGTTSTKDFVYGVELDDSYGCSDLTINGSGNKINVGTTNKTGIMYYCNCGAEIDHSTIVWNTEVAAVHADPTTAPNWYVAGQATNQYTISTAYELREFASLVNTGVNSFKGATVTLAADIDLNNQLWTPIGQTGATEFKGVFDGNGKTISNLYIDSSAQTGDDYSSGLFGWLEDHDEGIVIKNLTVDGATVTGHHNVAVIAGYIYGEIENCVVKNAKLSCTMATDEANGDKCGAIAGYAGPAADGVYIRNCKAENCTISAGRDAGQLVGAGYTASLDTFCTAINVTVTNNGTSTGANINATPIGRVLS